MSVLVNELVEIEQSEVKPRTSIANAHALYVALSKCKDLVQITDENFHLQYINRASEQYFGVRNEDVKGKPIGELHQGADYQSAISHQLARGKEWEGAVTCRRKSSDPISLPCRVIGSSTSSR